MTAFEGGSFLNTVWLALQVTVFAFSHAAAISGFANVQRREYGEQAEAKSSLILRNTTVMLVGFVLFFVFSCVLSLSRPSWPRPRPRTSRCSPISPTSQTTL